MSSGVGNASAAYLVAVVLVALLVGTDGAIVTAIGSAALYNFLFTEPRYTFEIHDPAVLLSVVLLLFVGVVVGRLAALQRERADTATAPRARGEGPVRRQPVARDARVHARGADADPRGPGARGRPGAGVDRDRVRPGRGVGRRRHRRRAGRPPSPGGSGCCSGRPATSPLGGSSSSGLAWRDGPRAWRDGRPGWRTPTGCGSRRAAGCSARSGRRGRGPPASRTRSRRGSSRPPRTRSARRSPSTGPRRRRARPRSPARATPSSPRCSSPSRTTCARRWPRSAPRPGACVPAAAFTDEQRRAGADAIEREVEYLDRLVTQPARPVPDRGRRAAAAAASCSTWTTSWRAPSRAPGRGSAGGASRWTCGRRPWRSTRCFVDEAVTQRARQRAQVHAARRR